MRRCRRTTLAAAAALAVLAGACTSDAGPGKVMADVVALDLRLASTLRPFDACGDLLDHVRTEAAAHAAQGQLAFPGRGMRRGDVMALEGDAVATSAPAAAPGATPQAAAEAATSAPSVSGTNIQEAGVDEPDVVKTDGRRIVTVAGGRLQVLVVEDGKHRLAGALPLPGASGGTPYPGTSGGTPYPGTSGDHDLLLAGDRVLVRSSTWSAAARSKAPIAEEPAGASADMMIAPGHERTLLTLVDISDPDTPAVESTFEVDGHVLGARMVGDVARVVTGAGPKGFTPLYPSDGSPAELSRVEAANRAQVEASTLRNWLPEFTRGAGNDGDQKVSGLVVECERVSRPAEFSGLGTISVLTFDLSEGLSDGDGVTVLADGQTVYASGQALYVATTRYPEIVPMTGSTGAPAPVPEETTEIHKFNITGDGPARHVASGRVRGHLLNQFSMSEHDGRLRVATTDSRSGGVPVPGGPGTSESLVTVLEDRTGVLEKAGEVAGLGRGEQIYAVRFIGPVGYVVTFRQTDPLYTLDLSDPASPRVVGELKIPGYSAYLHPAGDGLLLGVGQDATETGRRTGAQASLFDVSDPAQPRRLDQVALGLGSSSAEFDHHAFLWWEPRGLAVLPLQTYDPVYSSVAVGLSVDRGRGLGEAGRITHPLGAPEPGGKAAGDGTSLIQRSLVIDDALYTVSSAGILASNLGDLTVRQWVAF
ncbi:MAG: beta-propeller domain-containing protein [Actinomycetota bacterium]|nr:beta-propeller domain-containing protein [Actinomycetota bacterium]